ncbi:MAG: hypothetical protein MK106_05165 [Mariniblastus sp.]|nr:hypothetical protein [Mariniblastus sp.]
MPQRIFFAGTPSEAAHQAAPLADRLDLTLASPEIIVDAANPGDLVIFYSEHFDRFRDACQKLRQRDIATLYLVDGILEWRNAWENHPNEPACPYTMRPVLSHKIACIGASQARVVTSWGNPDKVEIVGLPRLDSLKQAKTSEALPDVFRLLVMTAKCPAFNEEQRDRVVQSLIDLKKWISEHPILAGKRVEVRWRLTAGLDQVIDVPNELHDLTGAELSSVLTHSDAVVSTPSTAALEAQLLDLPTAILDYTNSPQYVTSAWTISAAEHIGTILSELAEPREAKKVFQRFLLRDSLHLETSATDRLVDLVKKMLAVGKICIEQGTPLRFPSGMLSFPTCITAPIIGFKHETVYSDRPEFTQTNEIEVQTELAHARREIDHLNRQIEQLQSELGQAHNIFDQIQKHPIAGPVVRTREKIIGWLSDMKQPHPSSSHHQHASPKGKSSNQSKTQP